MLANESDVLFKVCACNSVKNFNMYLNNAISSGRRHEVQND